MTQPLASEVELNFDLYMDFHIMWSLLVSILYIRLFVAKPVNQFLDTTVWGSYGSLKPVAKSL